MKISTLLGVVLVVLLAVGLALFVFMGRAPLIDGPRQYLGALPEPADSMSSTEFTNFVNGLAQGGGEDGRRRCAGAPGCAGTNPTQVSTVWIGSIADANEVPMDHGHANGIIIAWFEHRAGPNEAQFGFLPMHKYYVVLFPDSIYQLRQVNPGGVHTWHGARRRYRVCDPPHDPLDAPAEALWLTCEQAHQRRPTRTAMSFVSAVQEFEGDSSLPWIRCPYGCCYTDPVTE